MEGIDKHLEFQIKLAGMNTGTENGSGAERNSNSTRSNGVNNRTPDWNTVPDNIPDIGMMVPIEKDN